MSDHPTIQRRLGITRRDLIRRGAVVGGTLLWTVPVVASISRAHVGAPHSPATGCCECTKPKNSSMPSPFCPGPQSQTDTPSKCAKACKQAGYTSSQYHTAPGYDSISCVTGVGCTTH
jgi:hypothetical protein